MNPIIRVDRTTQEIRLGLYRGCSPARLRMATLTVQRSGVWPKSVRTYENRMTPCGVQRVAVDTEVQPPEFVMVPARVTDTWEVVFVPSQAWLDAEDGRYSGVLSTACGDVEVEFQKAGVVRGHAAPVPVPACGEVGSTCLASPPSPPLALPTYVAVYNISGYSGLPNGPLITLTRALYQAWGVVSAPADTAQTTFSAWSDGVTTRTRDDGIALANRAPVTALFVPVTYTATYNISGHATVADGLLQAITRNAGQAWPDVAAPADSGGRVFSAWSDGVTTRTRNDGVATANRPAVTAVFVAVAYTARVTFETTSLPAGLVITGGLRTAVGGVVCATRELLRVGAPGVVSSGDLGGWYFYANTDTVSLSTTGSAWSGVCSFFYNSGSDIEVWAQIGGDWQLLTTLGATPILPQACSRNRWHEVVLPLNGSCTALEFFGVPDDFALDNITLGHNDALGPLPT